MQHSYECANFTNPVSNLIPVYYLTTREDICTLSTSAVVGSKAPWVLYFWCGLTGTYFI